MSISKERNLDQPVIDSIEIEKIIQIAKEAGDVVMEIYDNEAQFNQVETKSDNSPLTLADMASNRFIFEELHRLYPEIPIISEEEEQSPYAKRKYWNSFWLIDPLDGTKEFINRNGEFTINIALINNGKPILGVVYVPVPQVCYYGQENRGAFKIEGVNAPTRIQVNNHTENRIAMRSKSHASPEEEAILEKFGVKETRSAGSSLKFCQVADGTADMYFRHGPTMEWDIGAGHAVVRAAGGEVYQGNSPDLPMNYNKESLLNGSFLCLGFTP